MKKATFLNRCFYFIFTAPLTTGVVPAINNGRKLLADKEVTREISINQRGTVIIPKALVDDMGFEEGDSFYVKRVGDSVFLALIGRG